MPLPNDSNLVTRSGGPEAGEASAIEPARAKEGALATIRKSWFFRNVLVPYAATRLMLVIAGVLSLHLMGSNLPPGGWWEIGADGETATVADRPLTTDRALVNIWSRWDAGWYLQIAREGYMHSPGQQSNTAFFPLYPMLMRALHSLSGSESDASWFACGIAVSNFALIAGLAAFFLLVRREFDEETAKRAVWYILVFPTTLFFSAVYTEALFFAATVASIYYARTERWWLSGLAGAAAALTRSPGFVIVVPLAFEYMAQRNFRWRAIRWNALAVLLVPAALAAHMLFLRWQVGNALATRDAQVSWGGRVPTPSWFGDALYRFFQQPLVVHNGNHSIIDFIFTMTFLGLVIACFFKLRMSYAVFAAATFLFTTSWGTFGSMSRYVLIIFPAFMVLALAGRNPTFDRIYLTIGAGLASFFMILFTQWRWVG
jgi:hypothetical protein